MVSSRQQMKWSLLLCSRICTLGLILNIWSSLSRKFVLGCPFVCQVSGFPLITLCYLTSQWRSLWILNNRKSTLNFFATSKGLGICCYENWNQNQWFHWKTSAQCLSWSQCCKFKCIKWNLLTLKGKITS